MQAQHESLLSKEKGSSGLGQSPYASEHPQTEAYANLLMIITKTLEEVRLEVRAHVLKAGASVDPREFGSHLSIALTQRIFHQRGYYFVFRAGARTTNIQLAELTALVGNYITHVSTSAYSEDWPAVSSRKSCQFHSTSEVRETLENLWNSVIPDIDHLRSFSEFDNELYSGVLEVLKKAYAEIACTTVIVDALENSALVFLPNNLNLALREITIQSGYVHSSGKLIYCRNTNKSSIDECISSFRDYKDRRTKKSGVPFCLYVNEIFDKYEDDFVQAEISNGLSNLKFSGDKNYFGGVPLYSFRERLQREFKDFITFVTPRSHYKEQLRSLDGGKNGVIWLVKDRKIGTDWSRDGSDDIYVIYHQRYKNSDAICHFDEDKPAWIAPVTWPHTLTAAMLSLTLDRFNSDERLVIVDPFVGTGTSLIEAIKRYPNCEFWGGDLCSASKGAIIDNVNFFSSPGLAKRLIRKLEPLLVEREEFIAKYASTFKAKNHFDAHAEGDWLMQGIAAALDAVSHTLSAIDKSKMDVYQKVRMLSEADFGQFIERFHPIKDFEKRIGFYFSWKAVCKNASALAETRTNEVEKLYDYLDGFLKLLKKYSSFDGMTDKDSSVVILNDSCFGKEVAYNYYHLRDKLATCASRLICGPKTGEFSVFWETMMQELAGRSPDIVIMDPPYGFNTDREGLVGLTTLYTTIIKKVVQSAGIETHLLMCLPEKSHNGQTIPNFVTKDWVMARLFLESSGVVDIVNYANSKPFPSSNFRPPYFWRSPRALTRSIIHVILKRRRQKE